MREFDLRLLWWQRLAGPLLVFAGCLMVLASPLLVPWRLAAAGLAGSLGALLWGRYLRRRPACLQLRDGAAPRCRLANGRLHEVQRVTIGVAHPRLLAARLRLADGSGVDLWVPRAALSPGAHRELRAGLLRVRVTPPPARA